MNHIEHCHCRITLTDEDVFLRSALYILRIHMGLDAKSGILRILITLLGEDDNSTLSSIFTFVLIKIIEICQHFTVYPKKYAHGYCFAVLCCGYTLTDFPISIRLTSLALWQSNDCPSASKATLMNMDKYFLWVHYERLHNHNKAKHNKTVRIFLGIYCMSFIIYSFIKTFRHYFLFQTLIFHGYHDWRTEPWRRHQMEKFSALLALCAGNSPVSGEFPSQRPVARSFDVFFDLCPN